MDEKEMNTSNTEETIVENGANIEDETKEKLNSSNTEETIVEDDVNAEENSTEVNEDIIETPKETTVHFSADMNEEPIINHENDGDFEEYTFNKDINNKTPKKRGVGKIVTMCFFSLIFGVGGGFVGSKIYDMVTPNETPDTVINPSDVSTLAGAVAKVASPSVVEIRCETSSNEGFGVLQSKSAGSGVIYSEDGYIITNYHVIDGASIITVRTTAGETYTANLVGGDKEADLAVLKIDETGLTPASIGKSSDLQLGDFVLAIGNPTGELGGTISDGIVSSLARDVDIDGIVMKLLQTNAAVSPGNSGGGLFNSKGELIGIVNAKQTGENVEGIGFVIPSDTAIPVIDQIIENGDKTPNNNNAVTLGVSIRETEDGLVIEEVLKNSPAFKARLTVGDIIVELDGSDVSTFEKLKAKLSTYSQGSSAEIKVIRDGELQTFQLTF